MFARKTPWLKVVLKKRIVVHTTADQTIEGTLMESPKDGLILRAAVLRQATNAPLTMAGEVWIPREQVAFAQLDE